MRCIGGELKRLNMPRTRRRPATIPASTGFTFGGAILFVIKLIIFIYLMRALLPVAVQALE